MRWQPRCVPEAWLRAARSWVAKNGACMRSLELHTAEEQAAIADAVEAAAAAAAGPSGLPLVELKCQKPAGADMPRLLQTLSTSASSLTSLQLTLPGSKAKNTQLAAGLVGLTSLQKLCLRADGRAAKAAGYVSSLSPALASLTQLSQLQLSRVLLATADVKRLPPSLRVLSIDTRMGKDGGVGNARQETCYEEYYPLPPDIAALAALDLSAASSLKTLRLSELLPTDKLPHSLKTLSLGKPYSMDPVLTLTGLKQLFINPLILTTTEDYQPLGLDLLQDLWELDGLSEVRLVIKGEDGTGYFGGEFCPGEGRILEDTADVLPAITALRQLEIRDMFIHTRVLPQLGAGACTALTSLALHAGTRWQRRGLGRRQHDWRCCGPAPRHAGAAGAEADRPVAPAPVSVSAPRQAGGAACQRGQQGRRWPSGGHTPGHTEAGGRHLQPRVAEDPARGHQGGVACRPQAPQPRPHQRGAEGAAAGAGSWCRAACVWRAGMQSPHLGGHGGGLV